jgi:hypothetical protein
MGDDKIRFPYCSDQKPRHPSGHPIHLRPLPQGQRLADSRIRIEDQNTRATFPALGLIFGGWVHVALPE